MLKDRNNGTQLIQIEIKKTAYTQVRNRYGEIGKIFHRKSQQIGMAKGKIQAQTVIRRILDEFMKEVMNGISEKRDQILHADSRALATHSLWYVLETAHIQLTTPDIVRDSQTLKVDQLRDVRNKTLRCRNTAPHLSQNFRKNSRFLARHSIQMNGNQKWTRSLSHKLVPILDIQNNRDLESHIHYDSNSIREICKLRNQKLKMQNSENTGIPRSNPRDKKIPAERQKERKKVALPKLLTLRCGQAQNLVPPRSRTVEKVLIRNPFVDSSEEPPFKINPDFIAFTSIKTLLADAKPRPGIFFTEEISPNSGNLQILVNFPQKSRCPSSLEYPTGSRESEENEEKLESQTSADFTKRKQKKFCSKQLVKSCHCKLKKCHSKCIQRIKISNYQLYNHLMIGADEQSKSASATKQPNINFLHQKKDSFDQKGVRRSGFGQKLRL